MRVLAQSLIIISALLSDIVMPLSASADTLSVAGNQIQITATVKPMRYIVVDSSRAIKQIISNNADENSEVAVYLNTVQSYNLLPVTPEVSEQAALLMKETVLKPGVLYQRPAATKPKLKLVESGVMTIFTSFRK